MDRMVNERLRRAMLRAGYDTETLAEAAGVRRQERPALDRG